MMVTGLACLLALSAQTALPNETVRFQELYDLLKTNLLGATESDLNRAAVTGLLDQLRPRVTLVGQSAEAPATTLTGSPVSAEVFDRAFGYFRVNQVEAASPSEFFSAYERLLSTNKLKGLILDLRFTGGRDYGAAVAMADRFFAGEQPLIDWGLGWRKSTQKTNFIALPVAVLVNARTTGAAEALAGMLRHGGAALLIGTNTAGQASMSKEFTLQSGQRVRVAIAPVKVGGGAELPLTGLKPDIGVEVNPEDELAWQENAYKVFPRMARTGTTNELTLAGTNRPGRRRMNEAELVRMTREGTPPDSEATNPPARKTEQPATPAVNDPALARALDLLKGLVVVQQFRSI